MPTKKTTGAKKAPKKRTTSKAAKPHVTKMRAWPIRSVADLEIVQAPQLARLDWLVHSFSTVTGGTSRLERQREGGEKSTEHVLNLGYTDWDKRDAVMANRKKFYSALGAPKMRVAALKQIHSDAVHAVGGDALPMGAEAHQGDALITNVRGVLLTVQTADCIPILLADTKNKAVAAIHSGWRGTAQRISEKTLGRMRMEYGTRPEHVIAAIGPGIGASCYEVGHEVAQEFAAKFPNAQDWFTGPFEALTNSDNDPNWLPWLTMRPPGHAPPSPTVQLDLTAANKAILLAAGVAAKNIGATDLCTGCRPDLFFSYRKEKITGRMMAAIGIK